MKTIFFIGFCLLILGYLLEAIFFKNKILKYSILLVRVGIIVLVISVLVWVLTV